MMEPIRVLQVLTIMNRGGAETMIMNYYRNINRSKVQFDFLLHRKEEGVFDREIELLGGKIHRLSNINLKNLMAYKKELDEFFKQHNEYKIVHAHLNGLSVFVLNAARKNKVPVRIAHSHTSLYHLNINPFSKNRQPLSFVVRFFAQNIFKQNIPKYANYYYACGEKAGIWLFGKKNEPNITVINNAIDTSKFIYRKKVANDYKDKLNLNPQHLVIGHVGNFVQEKNHAFILNVFKELKNMEPKTTLVLVGGGDRTEFEARAKALKIEDSVQFLGVRSDVENILQAIDIFLFPSTNEGLPVTLIEAQASGLKIVASDEISSELNVTGLVNFCSLEKPPRFWANIILKEKLYNRIDTSKMITEANYDIKNNAQWLQDFYLTTNNLN